jgi:transposase
MVVASSLPVVGLDVSKATLAVCYQVNDQVKHLEVSNSKAGFQQLVKTCGAHCQFIMEATGTYNLALAYYLHEQGGQVAVLNPLVIKRFIQMHLSKGKSDRKDAQWLLRYGQQQVLKSWQPDETVLVECRQLEQVTEQLVKQKTMISNSLEALQRQPVISKLALKRLQQLLKSLTQQVAVELELLALLEWRFAAELTLLCTIPGIGRKTAGMLLLLVASRTSIITAKSLPWRVYRPASTLRVQASAERCASRKWAVDLFAASSSCAASQLRKRTQPVWRFLTAS